MRILIKSASKSSEEQVSTIGDAAESSPQSHFNRRCLSIDSSMGKCVANLLAEQTPDLLKKHWKIGSQLGL
jgi:hypothetical protein